MDAMGSAELAEVQRQILERFRRHTACIASERAEISEGYRPGSDALGNILELDLHSPDGSQCPFSATIGNSMAYVTVGRSQLDYLGHGSGTEEPSPDAIEESLLDAVRGNVKEIEWRLGRLQLQLDTLRRDESGRWVLLHSWGLPFLGSVWHLLSRLGLITEHIVCYESYI